MDSVVLLDLLVAAKCDVTIAHCNFQLRGDAADGDELWVKQLADRYQVPVFVKRFSTNNYAIERGVSIQMAARALRYAWFDQLLTEHNLDVVATAHHLNDSIETVILNLVRGTGLTGLTGISPGHGKIVRPLISFRRSDVENYAREHQLAWREDSSNGTDDYGRNFVRHQIIPKLRELNPSLEETFARTLQRMRAAEALAEDGLLQLKEKWITVRPGSLMIDKAVLTVSHAPAILYEFLKAFGFNFAQCEAIAKAGAGHSGKIFAAGEHQLTIDRSALIVHFKTGKPGCIEIPALPFEGVLGEWRMHGREITGTEIIRDRLAACVDLSLLRFPLVWRAWKDGDMFHPLGMTGSKKVSDFLIDGKVPVHEKDSVTVLESEGSIVWIAGFRPDNRFRVTHQTRTMAMFRLERKEYTGG